MTVLEIPEGKHFVDDEAIELAEREMQEWYACRTDSGTNIAVGIKIALRLLGLWEDKKALTLEGAVGATTNNTR